MLTLIDVSRVARRFRLVRLANYFMVVGAGTHLIGQLVNAPNVTRDWALFVGASWIGLSVAFWAGLKTTGVINDEMWRRLYFSLPILVVCCGALAKSLFRALPADIDAFRNPSGNAVFVAFALNALFAASGVAGFAAVVSLDRALIGPSSWRLRPLLRRIESSIDERSVAGKRQPASRSKSLLCAAAAAPMLIGPHFVPDEIWQPNAQVFSLLSLSGWAFVFHARRYSLPDATSLLEADERSQVVLLRSFEDDERHSYITSEMSVIDFGLETRLANHFGRFGPFVAIGSPKEATPRPGAATARLSDEDWQDVVKNWMDRARYVVLLAGTTRWVNWELSQVVVRGHAGKLILMFPRMPWWRFWGRSQDAQARLDKLCETLADTRWGSTLRRIDRPRDARAIALCNGEDVLMVTSRPRNRDAYHLAALIIQQHLADAASGVLPGAAQSTGRPVGATAA